MIRKRIGAYLRRSHAQVADELTDRLEAHGLELSVCNLLANYDSVRLQAKLQEALELIAVHAPVWIRRMQRLGVRIHVERTPGTRAKLLEGQLAVLDSYFVSTFLLAQIASSIVHEAAHAMVRARGIPFAQETLAREERACRRAELRFGKVLLARSVPGADAVIERAEGALSLKGEEIAPVVNWGELKALEQVTLMEEAGYPGWLIRWVARKVGAPGPRGSQGR
jgi:hypothetical protein